MIISLGMVLQKKGVHWLSFRREGNPDYRRLRATWLAGIILNNMLAFFYYFGLRGLPASIVGAMMGLNVVFTAVFSVFLLREHVPRRVALWSSLMVLGIVVANLAAPRVTQARAPSDVWIVVFFALPYTMVGAAMFAHRYLGLSSGLYAAAIAFAAGSLDGFIIVLIKVMQSVKGTILEYFLTPYAYLYIVASVSVISLMQLAYKKGTMTRVAPALYGAQIIWPVISSFLVFAIPVDGMQAAAFACVVLSVIMVQR
jgi:drug/metabolite transporter (DMT)-like permease